MNGIHKAVDCVIFNKNLVDVKLNLDHVKTFNVTRIGPCDGDAFRVDLLHLGLNITDQLIIKDYNDQKVLISFENQRTNQHKMST